MLSRSYRAFKDLFVFDEENFSCVFEGKVYETYEVRSIWSKRSHSSESNDGKWYQLFQTSKHNVLLLFQKKAVSKSLWEELSRRRTFQEKMCAQLLR